jgi:hypothetical protein
MARKKKQTPEELRAEADRIEREAHKAERLEDADKIPTCPECGGRIFKIESWTVVGQSISYEEDEDGGDWCDDYDSGDHTDESCGATCDECGADVEEMLGQHGWTFYDAPQPRDKPDAITIGTRVYWTDPDNDVASGAGMVTKINSEKAIDDETPITITKDDGGEAEVLRHELRVLPSTTPLDVTDVKHLRSAAERLRQGALDAAAAADMGRLIDLMLDHKGELSHDAK